MANATKLPCYVSSPLVEITSIPTLYLLLALYLTGVNPCSTMRIEPLASEIMIMLDFPPVRIHVGFGQGSPEK